MNTDSEWEKTWTEYGVLHQSKGHWEEGKKRRTNENSGVPGYGGTVLIY